MQLGQPQHPLIKHQSFAIGLGAFMCSLCYLLGVMMPVAGALFVYASPLPLFVIAAAFGFRSLAFSSLIAFIGISCVGSINLSLHFGLSVIAGVLWYGYIISSAKQGTRHKILMGWVILGFVSIALNTSDPELIQNLTKAVDLFYSSQLSQPQYETLAASRDDLLRLIQIVPAVLTILWIGALSLMLKAATWLGHKHLSLNLKQMKIYAGSLPEGCFYLMIIAALGCLLSSPELKLFFVNALVFSLFPFMNLGNDQIQTWMKALPSGRFWLIAFYVLCFLMMALLIGVALIGVGCFLKTYRFPLKRHNITNT